MENLPETILHIIVAQPVRVPAADDDDDDQTVYNTLILVRARWGRVQVDSNMGLYNRNTGDPSACGLIHTAAVAAAAARPLQGGPPPPTMP